MARQPVRAYTRFDPRTGKYIKVSEYEREVPLSRTLKEACVATWAHRRLVGNVAAGVAVVLGFAGAPVLIVGGTALAVVSNRRQLAEAAADMKPVVSELKERLETRAGLRPEPSDPPKGADDFDRRVNRLYDLVEAGDFDAFEREMAALLEAVAKSGGEFGDFEQAMLEEARKFSDWQRARIAKAVRRQKRQHRLAQMGLTPEQLAQCCQEFLDGGFEGLWRADLSKSAPKTTETPPAAARRKKREQEQEEEARPSALAYASWGLLDLMEKALERAGSEHRAKGHPRPATEPEPAAA